MLLSYSVSYTNNYEQFDNGLLLVPKGPLLFGWSKVIAKGRSRTLYSFRYFYASQDLERGVTTRALSRQFGNSTEMIDRHYSKYSPLLNAEVHSGRKKKH